MSNQEIIKQLKNLKKLEAGGRPQEAWILSNKEILMSQINPQSAPVAETADSSYYYRQYFGQLFQGAMKPVGVAFMVVAAYFGYTATATIASASLPGELLYPVKTTSEKVQLALTFDESDKVHLQMNFVSRRGDELQQLAKQDDKSPEQKERISNTVKKITSDVKQVNEKLNKIVMASAPIDSINLAKDIDDKTLKVEKDIVDAHASLSTEVKKDVAKDVKEAIATTEEVGTKALNMIVEKSSDNKTDVSQTDIANRVSERIKNTENSLTVAVNEVNRVASTSLPLVATSSIIKTENLNASSSLSTTTMKDIVEKPKQAQEVIEQAKDLLDKKDFTSALEKIKEGKIIVGEVIAQTQTVIDAQIGSSKVNDQPASSTVIRVDGTK